MNITPVNMLPKSSHCISDLVPDSKRLCDITFRWKVWIVLPWCDWDLMRKLTFPLPSKCHKAVLILSMLALVAPALQARDETHPAPRTNQIYADFQSTGTAEVAAPARRGGPAIHAMGLPLTSNGTNGPLLESNARFDYNIKPYVQGQPLVMMAISGGGSRSAYYAAKVMDELSQIPLPGIKYQPGPNGAALYSLLDSVRVISTVSAGGLAASYYVTHFDYRKQPGFFEDFASAMAVNLQWATYGHMAMFPPLAIQLLASNVTRTDLLGDQIDKLLGGQKLTFNDLRKSELRPVDPSPVLLVNGTIYNSGQRLVMTNLPGERFPSLLENEGPRVTMPDVDRQTLRNLVQPLTFADFGSNIGTFRLSQALAASAAYPIVLAPVPLRVYPANVPSDLIGRVDQKLLMSKIAYVADGGLYENEGVDPLLSLIKTLPRKLPILLIIVDGSERMETMSLKEGKVWGPISVISRMYDIGTLKPLAYYRSMLANYHDQDKIEVVFIRMEGYDANSQQKLREIPTTFKLSEDHVAVLDQAARANVARMAPALLGAFGRLSETRRHHK
jgi:hypothetical protein